MIGAGDRTVWPPMRCASPVGTARNRAERFIHLRVPKPFMADSGRPVVADNWLNTNFERLPSDPQATSDCQSNFFCHVSPARFGAGGCRTVVDWTY